MTDSELQALNEALKTYRFRWQHARTLERELEQLEGAATEAEKKIITLDKDDSSTWLDRWKKWLARMQRKSLVEKLSDKRQKRVERIRVIRLLQKDYQSMESVHQDLIDKKKKYIKDNWEADWQDVLRYERRIDWTIDKAEALENVLKMDDLTMTALGDLLRWLLDNKAMFFEGKEVRKSNNAASKEDYILYDELSSLFKNQLLTYQRVVKGTRLKVSILERWMRAYLEGKWNFHLRLGEYLNGRKYLELVKVLKKLNKVMRKVQLEATKRHKLLESKVIIQKIAYYKLLEAEK